MDIQINLGTQLKNFREQRHLLKTSFLRNGMQPMMISNLESGKGNVSNLMKYLAVLGIQINLQPITPLSNSKYVYRLYKKSHISYDGKITICGQSIPLACELISKVDGSFELNKSQKSEYCKRCLDGYNKREKQINLPLG